MLKLDPQQTGMREVVLRHDDLDGDGVADLLWLQATGLAPGHMDAPIHDDPWWRALLVNLNGEWRLLAVDTLSYGCGC